MEIQIAYCFRLISGTFNCRRKVRMIVADQFGGHISEDHALIDFYGILKLKEIVDIGTKLRYYKT